MSSSGENFGWPRYEGTVDFNTNADTIMPTSRFPIFEYPQDENNQFSVIALVAYRQHEFPNDASFPIEYDGTLFYTDFYHNWIYSLRPTGEESWESVEFGTGFTNLVDGALGGDGSIYLLHFGGPLRKVIYDTGVLTVWQSSMSVSDNCGGSSDLTYGFGSSAQDGLDLRYGEAELPPTPPSEIFDARFELPISPTIHSLTDFRNDTLMSVSWLLKFQPGSCGYPVTFTWNSSTLPQGSFYLKDVINGTVVNVDMKTQGSFTLNIQGVTSLKIEYSQIIVKNVNVVTGWNILSVPVLASDMSKDNLFPSAVTPAYAFDKGYIGSNILENGKGYWLKFNAPKILQITGSRVASSVIPVQSGWNLIGPCGENISVSGITSSPSSIISSSFFAYNTGYAIAESLEFGTGYWIKVNQDGYLNNISSGGIRKGWTLIEQLSNDPESDWGRIIISDADNNSGTLYLAQEEIDLGRYELPPTPPASVFDVRYDGDRYVEVIGKQDINIKISSPSYPIRLRIEGIDLSIRDALSGNMLNRGLLSGEEIVIANPNINLLAVTTSAVIPQKYELFQNYPNPFNPTTRIRFALPEAGKVKLTLYNVLGEFVEELVNQEFGFGVHEVELNASQYAAGVYFYKIEVGEFRDYEKMILLK